MKKSIKILISFLFIFILLCILNKNYAVTELLMDKNKKNISKDDTIQMETGESIDIYMGFEKSAYENTAQKYFYSKTYNNKDYSKPILCTNADVISSSYSKNCSTVVGQKLHKVHIEAKKEGEVEIICIGILAHNGITNEPFFDTPLEIRVKIKVVMSEEDKLKQQIAAAEEEEEKMKTAYKSEPTEDATANDILRFIRSDATYNLMQSLSKVSVEKATTWRNTVEEEMIDTISRKMYYETYATLNRYINSDGDINEAKTFQSELIDQQNSTEEANQETIESYRSKLAALTEGEGRAYATFTSVFDSTDSYTPTEVGDTDNYTKATEITNKVLSIITSIGMVVSVIVPLILGIKYMIGSIEEKAEYKKGLIAYVIGAVLLFGICALVKTMQAIGTDIGKI